MAETVAGWGAGPLRVHDGGAADAAYPPPSAGDWRAQPAGIDLLLDRALIRRHFPYVADDTVALLHARRCGWLSGQQLGMHLLELARRAGAELVDGPPRGGRRRRRAASPGVRIDGPGGSPVARAPSAWSSPRGRSFPTPRGSSGSRCPCSPSSTTRSRSRTRSARSRATRRSSSGTTRQTLAVEPGGARRRSRRIPGSAGCSSRFPPGVHTRPEGASPESRTLLVLWSYDSAATDGRLPDAGAALLHRARPPRDGAHAAGLCGLPRPDAARLRRRRLLREDAREPAADRPAARSRAPTSRARTRASASWRAAPAASWSRPTSPARRCRTTPPAFLLSRYDDPAYVRRIEACGATGQI